MAGTLVASTLSNGSNSIGLDAVIQGSLKARVCFDSTVTPLNIMDQVNVSSITDVGVGNFIVNFAKPLAKDTYLSVGSGQRVGKYSDIVMSLLSSNSVNTTVAGSSKAQSVNNLSVYFNDAGGGGGDMLICSIGVFL